MNKKQIYFNNKAVFEKESLLGDDAPKTWVEIFRAGDYKGYGEDGVNWSVEDLQKVVDNFNDQEVQNQVPIHVGHPYEEVPALGWIRELKLEADGLLKAFVEFLPDLADQIKAGMWKYCSVELVNNAKHQKSGELIGGVLLGLGITNNPFIAGMAPITFSKNKLSKELYDLYVIEDKENMDKVLELLKGILGVEELSEEDLLKVLEEADKEILAKCLKGEEVKPEEMVKPKGGDVVCSDPVVEEVEDEELEEEEDVAMKASKLLEDKNKLMAFEISDKLKSKQLAFKDAHIKHLETYARKQVETDVVEYIKSGRVPAADKDAAIKLMLLDVAQFNSVFPKDDVKVGAMTTFTKGTLKEEVSKYTDEKNRAAEEKHKKIINSLKRS